MAVIVSASGASPSVARPSQTQVVFAGGYWWLFYYTSTSTSTLYCRYSSDLVTWTQAASLTPTIFSNTGDSFNIDAESKLIGSVWVVHIVQGYEIGTNQWATTHTRATISGTTISYGTETQVGNTATDGNQYECGPKVCILSDNRVMIASSYWNDTNGWANPAASVSTNADLGSGGWTEGWPGPFSMATANANCTSHFVASLGSGNGLYISDDGSDYTTLNDLIYSVYTSSNTSYTGVSTIYSPSPAILRNNWSALRVSDTDIHVMIKISTGDFEHFRFNGSSWSSGQTVPSQSSQDNSGPKLMTDGTNVWLFILDSDSNNTVRVIKWTALVPSWGTWAAFVTTALTRTYISGASGANNKKLAPIWMESTSDISDASYPLGPTNFAPGCLQSGASAYYAF